MSRRASNRAEHLRRAVAVEAARLMAEHGIRDFLAAKRKAAERLGVGEGAAWPRNTEIEAALAEHQRLFAAEDHARALRGLRATALHAMLSLAEFEPRLVGPVLSGTATTHAEVQLHLFAERAEAVTLKLLDRGLRPEVLERRVRLDAERTRGLPGVRYELEDAQIEATIFPRDGIRQAPLSPVDGRPMRRASAAELQALLGPAGPADP